MPQNPKQAPGPGLRPDPGIEPGEKIAGDPGGPRHA
jgi:hypothetical protein